MSTGNSDKNKFVLKELEKTISPVLVVNNSSLKPFVELFEYAPENIYQQPLGNLVGFFEVKEYSDESAYIVNFLTSVLKKEYYINPKRPVTESLDSALHKVNLALSELAKHGNINWLGKINAAICVLEKNNAHFSVSGDAKIFLYRNTALSEISEDLASDEPEPHPIKTFINVSSGRLEKNDRLLITSADIFQILPLTEIKKNFQRFEGEKFVQFLKTALSNQMEMLASVVIEMIEPVEEAATKKTAKKKSSSVTNVFSEKTFANSISKETFSPGDTLSDSEEQNEDSNYTDKKTGHIYIQGETIDPANNTNPQINLYKDLAKEKITRGAFLIKNELRKRFSLYKKKLAKKRALREAEKERSNQLAAEETVRIQEQSILEEIKLQQIRSDEAETQKNKEEQEVVRKNLIKEKEFSSPEQTDADNETQDEVPSDNQEMSFKEKLKLAQKEYKRSAIIDLRNKKESLEIPGEAEEILETTDELELKKETGEEKNKASKLASSKLFAKNLFERSVAIIEKSRISIPAFSQKIQAKLKREKNSQKKEVGATSIIPHFSKIKGLFSRFTTKQKTYTIISLLAIFIVPLFIVHVLNQPKTPTIANLQVAVPSQADLLANEKNINLKTTTKIIYSGQDIISSIITNESPVLITKNSVVILQNQQPKTFPFPAGIGLPTKATFMKDLSLILILTDSNKVVSFSPVSEKFTENKIDLNNISQSSFIGTYLTYLYVLDKNSNQIYRYPRADGGFGQRSSWLKDSIPLSTVSDMTIDDNIYAVANNQVLKLFKGKTAPFMLEASATPVHLSKFYTNPDLQSLYALDTQNARIVQYSKDGNILAQFYNETLKDGSSLSVDEQSKVAFFATPSGLIEISLQ